MLSTTSGLSVSRSGDDDDIGVVIGLSPLADGWRTSPQWARPGRGFKFSDTYSRIMHLNRGGLSILASSGYMLALS